MTTPTPGNGPAGGPALPKLGPGELRARVAGVLASAPNRAWTVTAITAVLNGRSAGAVGAACDRLVELGQARQLPGSPRRYQPPATTPTAGPAGPTAAPTGPTAAPRPAGRPAVPARPTTGPVA